MTSSMNTILIIGATGGIGEAAASRFHSMGKKVIITGRRTERLDAIAKSHPGLKTYAFDMSELSALPDHVDKLLSEYPEIDTVWVNGGLSQLFDVKELDSISDERVLFEINTNLSAPIILARHIIPRFLSAGKERNFMVTSSGIAITPVFFAPGYSAEKAAVHAFMCSIRQQLKGTNVNAIEIVPPFVKTNLMDGAADHPVLSKMVPMPLEDFTNEIFEIMDNTPAKELKEVGAGSAAERVADWRRVIGGWMAKAGMVDA